MSEVTPDRLVRLSHADTRPLLRTLQRGIERETLRVRPDGALAQSPHPSLLGSALTHPLITTDYSEALLEFITPVASNVGDVLRELDKIHRFVDATLDNELLWNASMPCVLGADEDIPVARYGSSNSGRMKTVYRLGLGHRYGRHMQTIAGIHYNFSVPDDLWPALLGCDRVDQAMIDAAYFGLIRNFRRYCWLLIYLLGASPALSRSFLDGKSHRLDAFDAETLHAPYGTSLRMGDLGYQSAAQEQLRICYNQLSTYIDTLRHGILEPYPAYEQLGVRTDGHYRQLSAGLLQIENEFYSSIRPKRVAARGETALSALAHRGVQYIEVRCLDINPYLPMGIDAETIRFLDAFLLYCLAAESPACDERTSAELRENIQHTVIDGRRPGLMLQREGKPIALSNWGQALLDAIEPFSELLDGAAGGDDYRGALRAQRHKLADPDRTPSARLLNDMRRDRLSFVELTLALSQQHAAALRARPLSPAEQTAFAALARESLAGQAELEQQPQPPFEQYLAHYFDQYRAL